MRYYLLLVITFALLGCGRAAAPPSAKRVPVATTPRPLLSGEMDATNKILAPGNNFALTNYKQMGATATESLLQMGAEFHAEVTPSDKTPNVDAVRRKIVYRATVDLVVEDFEPVPARIEALVKQFDAYLARSNVSGEPGIPRTGHWTFRVPADRYDAFLDGLAPVGRGSPH